MPKPEPNDADEAIKLAIRAAVEEGDVGRARALLDLLEAPTKPPVSAAKRRGG